MKRANTNKKCKFHPAYENIYVCTEHECNFCLLCPKCITSHHKGHLIEEIDNCSPTTRHPKRVSLQNEFESLRSKANIVNG